MSTTPHLSPRRRWALTGIAILLLTTSVLGARAIPGTLEEKAEAHVRFSTDRWAFRGMTIDKSGLRSAMKDPLNIIFMGGHDFLYTNAVVRNHIDDHANWGGAWPCASRQRVVWQRRNTRATTSDKEDFQLDNVKPWNCWRSRWHLRAWDDYEHYNYTDEHPRRYKWIVAGVHYDQLVWTVDCPNGCAPRPTHKIGKDWDVARREMIEKMSGHCSWPKWDRHAGARIGKRAGQGYRNSGWIGRISLKHTSGGC